MKNYRLTISALFFFFLFTLSGRNVFADDATTSLPAVITSSTASTAPGFTFTFQNKNFAVSAAKVSQWQSVQTVEPAAILAPPEPDFTNSLLAFVSQSVPQENNIRYYNYSLSQIYDYITTLSQGINATTQEPALQIQNGRAEDFTPPQTGQQLDVYKSALGALDALALGKDSSSLDVVQTPPQNSLAQTNNLGINQLIAEGVSKFNGSPDNRRVNIAVGIEKFKGLIIPQGATFSFDDNLGPVTADAGFLPELVIDDGNTLPELGGGLCQVSTTVFRAAMAAGVPITDRRNHAYAVEYYSPQGTDATIYPGSADLKFVNDTPGAILIWPYEKDSNTLVFDFYGTDDGRKVTLEKPVVYDRQTDGAMKATWTRLVTNAAGVTRTDVFNSNYQSPALFHKVETYVSATGTQTSGLTLSKTQ